MNGTFGNVCVKDLETLKQYGISKKHILAKMETAPEDIIKMEITVSVGDVVVNKDGKQFMLRKNPVYSFVRLEDGHLVTESYVGTIVQFFKNPVIKVEMGG